MNLALKDILSGLKGVKRVNKGWRAHCPAHDDKKPSLHVSKGDNGRVLLYCHAGCSANAICQAIGIKVADLFPKEPASKRTPVIATYDYQGTDGKLLFQVCRTADKRFFQRRPDGKCWINGLAGIKPVIYKLPEVLQAVKTGETIFIPEGEKDCDNLAALGLTATTSPMGAGKWRPWYAENLKGANVVILPDNDGPGRKHSQQVAQSLHGKAASIKVLELPGLTETGDVSDWLENGGVKEELLRLAQAAPEWRPKTAEGQLVAMTAAELLNSELPQREDIIGGGILPKGGMAMLAGQFKSGKTILALQIALEAARGGEVLEFTTTKGRTLILSGEGGPQLLKERLEKMIGSNQTGLEDLLLWWPTEGRLDLAEDKSLTALKEYCLNSKVDFLIIDPLIRFNSYDENSTVEMGAFVRGLAEVRQATGVAMLLVHHTRKSAGKGNSGSGAEARGSSVLAGEVDSLMMLQSRRASSDFTLHFELRWAEEPPALRLELDPETLLFSVAGELEGKRKLSAKKLYDLLRETGPSTVKELKKLTGTSDKTVRTYLKELEAQKLACQEPPVGKGPWIWRHLPER